MLRQAYHFINDKEMFRCVGRQEEQARLREMLSIVIQTKIGRSIVVDIGNLYHQQQKKRSITLKMVRPAKKTAGWSNENLEVGVNRIALTDMTKRQKDKTLLVQSITLLHELAHIRQFLLGYEKEIQKFSVPHQLYANIFEELEASLAERSFEIELRKLYPTLCRGMNLYKPEPRWREKFARSFFVGSPNKNVYTWIDFFADFAREQEEIVLENKEEKNIFRRWVNKSLKKINLPFTYQNFPLERMFWVRKKPNALAVLGNDSSLVFGQEGRLLAIGKGFEKKKESSLCFSVFVYKRGNPEAQKVVEEIMKQHPKSCIFLTQGGKEKHFRLSSTRKKTRN